MSNWQPPKNYQTRPVVVLGGGVLGRRIAACYAAGGWPIRIRDPSAAQRDAAMDYIKTNIGTFTALTRRKPGAWEAMEDLAAAVKDAWLVVEAVPEKLEIKLSTFGDLEKFAPKDAILASNSSSFKSGELVERMSAEGKKRVLNTHFMMPPEALIVELMTDGHTDPGIFPFMAEQLKMAGLHPIVALRESTGFVFNRIWAAIKRETMKVLAEGVSTPSEIDRVFMEQYGAREGPCHMMDNVGLDTVENIENHYIKERGLERSHLDWLHKNYIEPGKLGKKSGKGGFYDVPAPGAQTVLYFLNIGLAETIQPGDSPSQMLRKGQVLKYNVSEGGKPTEILGHDAMPDGIDIHVKTNRMYWTEMGVPSANDGAIYSATLTGADVRTVVPPGACHTPKQCTIDQEAGKLYFCDREGLRVMRVGLDGSGLETLVQTGDWREGNADQTKWCVGIAVSRNLGRFFWTQKGASKKGEGRIFSAALEMPKDATPSTRADITTIAANLPEPVDLDVDDDAGVLWWTDRGELPMGNTLNRKHLLDNTVSAQEKSLGREIMAQGFGEAIGLRHDRGNGCLWVTDIVGRIWKCSAKSPGLKEKVYEGATGAFTGIAVTRE